MGLKYISGVYNVIPCFKSEYSIGKSILTLDKCKDKIDESRAISIGTICKLNNISPVYIVDDTMAGFFRAYSLFNDLGIEFRFGLRLTVCNDASIKTEESLKTNSKIVIFIKNTDGYKDILKIHNIASTTNFYYEKRADWNLLRQYWTDNLQLVYPFFDSFIHNNLLTFGSCLVDDSFTTPAFLDESHHDLPFCDLIKDGIDNYVKSCSNSSNIEILKAHSIYYYSERQFKAFNLFRAVQNRGTLSKSNLEHFSTDSFNFEKWIEINQIIK